MEPLDVDALLAKAKVGQLSEAEAEAVYRRLQRARPDDADDRRYTLLYILGRTGDVRYRPVLEAVLDDRRDLDLASLALWLLTRAWGAARYRDRLLAFVRGVPWDEFDELRERALRLSGQYLRTPSDPALLRAVLQVVEDGTLPDWTRWAAYVALAAAAGATPQEEFRLSLQPFELATDIDQRVIANARQRLTDSGGRGR